MKLNSRALVNKAVQTGNFSSIQTIRVDLSVLCKSVLTNTNIFSQSFNPKELTNCGPKTFFPGDEIIFNTGRDMKKA